MSTIVVTGGSGFIATHCIVKLLEAGHEVRATLRDLQRESETRAMIRHGGGDDQRVSFFAAHLSSDVGWKEAIQGARFVLHVASPTLATVPKNDDDFVRPAREGVLRVLKLSRDAGVQRVVLTSAFGAVGYGHPPREAPFTEEDWTQVDGDVAPYQKSKTLAERAAWDFIRTEGGDLELSVVNPGAVLGPLLGPDVGPSLQLTLRLLTGAMPGCPKFSCPFVDVRDVADLHVRAMTLPQARGERFLASSGPPLSVLDISRVMHQRLGALGARAPQSEIPMWLLRLLALVRADVRTLRPQLGKRFSASSEKAARMLGWIPRPNEDSIVDTARSFVRFGLVPGFEPSSVAER